MAANHPLSEFEHLRGKRVQFFYKATASQRKWRPGFINLCFGETTYDYGQRLAIQENYHDWTFRGDSLATTLVKNL